MAGLLWAGLTTAAHARELELGDPTRVALMDMARDTPAAGLSSASRLTFSRVFADNTQARLCGLATRLDGDLLIQDGRLQMKRVFFRKHGAKWEVERSERIAVPPEQSVETACGGQRAADAVMTAAIKEMETHPPTAGVPVTVASKPLLSPTMTAKAVLAQAPTATGKPRCDGTEPQDATTEPVRGASAGVVALPGRSLLHTAPDLACYMGKHIVRGDKVDILAHVPGWTRVRYTHPLSGAVTVGWLQSERLKSDSVKAALLN